MDEDIDLSDFLGHILTEITRARVQADMESIRIAEMYANHDLLQHFPIPRVRLPEVEINLPVILGDIPQITFDDEHDDDGKGGKVRIGISSCCF